MADHGVSGGVSRAPSTHADDVELVMAEGKAFLSRDLRQLSIKTTFDRFWNDDVTYRSTRRTHHMVMVFGQLLRQLEDRRAIVGHNP